MVTAPVAIALLGAVTIIAIAAAGVAIRQARAARAALRAGDQKHGQNIEPPRPMEADTALAAEVAHDLTDLLTAITEHADRLIANLDPSGTSVQDAYAIRRAAASATRLTRRPRTLNRDRPGPIDLPATSEPAALPDRAAAEAPLPATVLVVEDEPGMRELIRLALARAGHAVVTVTGARAALAALKSRQPPISLMLVDVVMPEMDGYDLVAEARKISPGVRVVFMSAFAPDPERHPSGDGFLAKPFAIELLIEVVENALAS